MLKKISEQGLQKANNWFTANSLLMNKDKTNSIVFSSNKSHIKGISLKYLGIFLDDRRSWNDHINYLQKVLSKSIFVLRTLKKVLSLDTLRSSYFALFHSHLTYGAVLWGNSCQAERIFILQKRAIRVIMGASYREHCQPLFVQLHIMPLPCVFIYASLLEVHKQKDHLAVGADFHEYDTRYSTAVRQPFYRLNKSVKNSSRIDLYNCH